jgi:hypothetical protein
VSSEHGNTAPNSLPAFLRGQLITHAGFLVAPPIAPFAAASQLEAVLNFGGLLAGADTTCDPSGITASTIVVAKPEVVSFT